MVVLMSYTNDVTEIKRLAGQVKKLIDGGETSESKHAPQAIYNAKKRVELMRKDLAHLVGTLKQFAPAAPKRKPAAPGPSEVKDGA
jgi:hypothetical protein